MAFCLFFDLVMLYPGNSDRILIAVWAFAA